MFGTNVRVYDVKIIWNLEIDLTAFDDDNFRRVCYISDMCYTVDDIILHKYAKTPMINSTSSTNVVKRSESRKSHWLNCFLHADNITIGEYISEICDASLRSLRFPFMKRFYVPGCDGERRNVRFKNEDFEAVQSAAVGF